MRSLTITFLVAAALGACQSTTIHNHGDGTVIATEAVDYNGEATKAVAAGVQEALPIVAEAQVAPVDQPAEAVDEPEVIDAPVMVEPLPEDLP